MSNEKGKWHGTARTDPRYSEAEDFVSKFMPEKKSMLFESVDSESTQKKKNGSFWPF